MEIEKPEDMGLITQFRSALVQAKYNERMADILAKEIAYICIMGAVITGLLFGWGAFWWGLLLLPILFAIGFSIPIISDIFLIILGGLWGLPFVLIAIFTGWSAFWGFGVLAFFMSFWVHFKGFTYFADLSRTDDHDKW